MDPSFSILLRCDTGSSIGLGHFVRCLALAEELAARGADVRFVADFGGLDWPRRQLDRRGLAHTPPAGAGPERLAAQAHEQAADVVVVDSYACDEAFFAALTGHGFGVAVIDDEARRPLPVDLLVNPNFGADSFVYRTRPDTRRLLGAAFALLRRDVREARAAAKRRFAGPARRVLVILGGTDPAGLTPTALAALGIAATDLSVRVIAGAFPRPLGVAPAGLDCTVLPGVDDMAEPMLWCDLAVSAAGSTAWELACLGTPMALVPVAENQQVVYGPLVAAGAAVGLGAAADASPASWGRLLAPVLADADRRESLSRSAARLIDGAGAQRVADAIVALAAEAKKHA